MKNIDYKEFITAWNKSKTPQEVAEKFNVNREQVIQLSSTLRRRDIFMKKMRKGPLHKEQWEELAKFSKQFAKKSTTSPVSLSN